MQTATLRTVDAHGQCHEFAVQAPLILGRYATFKVGPKDRDTATHFELTVDMSGSSARIVLMNHQGDPFYAKKGIPEAVILHTATVLDMPVRSNTATMETPESNAREPEATKVWQRLVAQSKARYADEQDVFQTT